MRILITGANGLLGQKLLAALESKPHEVLATSKGPNRALAGLYTYEPLDITDEKAARKVVLAFKPDVVIHTAAMTQVDPCEQNQEECWRINVDGTCNLLDAAEKAKAHFIHLSTDFVFDGTAGPYKEDDKPNPVNFYGVSKLAAEQSVQDYGGTWSILRTILVFGVIPNRSRSNIVLRVKESLEAGKPIRIVNDQIRMPTLAEDLATACLLIAERKAAGLYHISGGETMSMYDLARKTAEFFKLDASLIQPVTSAELKEPAKRPVKTGFILDKAKRDLGYQPTPLNQAFRIIAGQL